jgi:hypothetical protein
LKINYKKTILYFNPAKLFVAILARASASSAFRANTFSGAPATNFRLPV